MRDSLDEIVLIPNELYLMGFRISGFGAIYDKLKKVKNLTGEI
jgi:hypothetical protein